MKILRFLTILLLNLYIFLYSSKADVPTIDMIFVLDTSGSLSDEANSLQDAIKNIQSSLSSNPNFNINFKVFSIYTISDYTCSICEGSVYELIPNSTINQYEDWGPAVYDLATKYTDWTPNAIKVIVPISDEGPEDGDPVDTADEEITKLAAQAAEDNNIYVIPVLGNGASSDVENLALLMSGKLGKVLKTTDGSFTPETMEEILNQIIAEVYGGYVYLNKWDVISMLKGILIKIEDAPGAEKYIYEIYDENKKLITSGETSSPSIKISLSSNYTGNLLVRLNAYGTDFEGNTIESGWQEKTIYYQPLDLTNQFDVCKDPTTSLCIYFKDLAQRFFNFISNINFGEISPYNPSSSIVKENRTVNDPVDISTGNWNYNHTDIYIPTAGVPFTVVRYYNSLSDNRGWFFNLEPSIDLSDLNNIVVYWSGGSKDTFMKSENMWISPYSNDKLYTSSGYYVIEKIGGIKYYFDSNGKIYKVTDRKGNGYLYEYSTNSITIKDTLGNTLATIEKDTNGNIISITDAKGNSIKYNYNSEGNIVSYTDRNGNKITYEYDSKGILYRVIGPDGNPFVENQYDDTGRVISQKDGAGNETKFSYNIIPNTLVSAETVVTYPDGTQKVYKNLNVFPVEVTTNNISQKFDYDNNGNITKIIDPNGKEWNYSYNEFGFIATSTDPLGNAYKYSYDENGNLISVEDPNGNKIYYTYDNLNNLIEILYPDETAIKIDYNEINLPVKITDPLGNAIEYTYNSRGFIETIKQKNGAVYTYLYDELGNLTKVTDPLKRETTYSYDKEGKLLTITDPAGYKTSFEYNSYGDLISITDPKNRKVQFEYNVDGLLTKITLADGRTRERKYDPLGRIIEEKDELGRVIKFEYDELGRLAKITDPKGKTLTFIYDNVGNIIKIVDAKGNEVKTDYDELYRPTKFFNAYGKVVSQIQYDAVSLPIKIEDVTNRTLEFIYDPMYRLQKAILSKEITAEATYNELGKISKIIDPKSNETLYEYDVLGNLIKEINPLGFEWVYQYDEIGRLIKATAPNGNTVEYSYDNLDRIAKLSFSKDSLKKDITFTYDEVGNILSVEDEIGKIEYKYDVNDRVTERKDVFGNTVKYIYDSSGRVSQIIYPDGKIVEYTYDENDNLITIKDWANRITTFDYDDNDNLIKITYPNGAYTLYGYDANDKLIYVKNYSKDGKLITSTELQRNDAGEIISVKRTDYIEADYSKIKPLTFQYNEFNQITSSNEGEFVYDNNGNLLNYIYDGKKINLTYDLTNKLIEARIGSDIYRYTYDAEGNRIIVDKNGTRKLYVVDNVLGLSKPLAEMDSNKNILKYYIWANNGLVYSVDKDGNIYIYFYDYKGNTTAVINNSNEILAAYTYSAHGKILGSYEQENFENIFKFLGKYGVISDNENLYYVRARYYSPDLIRWTQPDVLRGSIVSPLSLNRYAYNEGDFVNYVDILGLKRELIDAAQLGTYLTRSKIVVDTAISTSYKRIVRKFSRGMKAYLLGMSNAILGADFSIEDYIKGKRGMTGITRRLNVYNLSRTRKLTSLSTGLGNVGGLLTLWINADKYSQEVDSVEDVGEFLYKSGSSTIIDIVGGTMQEATNIIGYSIEGYAQIYSLITNDTDVVQKVRNIRKETVEALKEGTERFKNVVITGIDKTVNFLGNGVDKVSNLINSLF